MTVNAPQLTLLLGGARSGKSAEAERLAAASGAPVLYVATAEVRDDEMAERVARHVARRPAAWRTLDAPLALVEAVTASASAREVVLIDALDVWLANALLAELGETVAETIARPLAQESERLVLDEVDALARWASGRRAPVLIVSSEAGMGVVPPYPLGRLFRDVLGAANQTVAAAAGRVLLLVAGIPLDVRRS